WDDDLLRRVLLAGGRRASARRGRRAPHERRSIGCQVAELDPHPRRRDRALPRRRPLGRASPRDSAASGSPRRAGRGVHPHSLLTKGHTMALTRLSAAIAVLAAAIIAVATAASEPGGAIAFSRYDDTGNPHIMVTSLRGGGEREITLPFPGDN